MQTPEIDWHDIMACWKPHGQCPTKITLCINNQIAMGRYQAKLRWSVKAQECEPTTVQTRWVHRIIDLPVAEPPSSRTASPSKTRARSPGVHDPDALALDTSFQLPKRSRTSGKVRGTF